MKNSKEFKVQELEQRLEMRKWKLGAGTSTDHDGNTTITTHADVEF